MLRDWGAEEKYQHVLKGYNYRLEGLQGAILRVKLRHIEDWTQSRREKAGLYKQLLAENGIQIPEEMPSGRHVYHIFAIRTSERDVLQQALLAQGIHTGIHYPIPVHLQPAYADLGYQAGDFPHAEEAAREVLSLPMFAELSNEQVERVATALRMPMYQH
jgi:dTDP-4-amino-4,6-dideoxygalactose transaminase